MAKWLMDKVTSLKQCHVVSISKYRLIINPSVVILMKNYRRGGYKSNGIYDMEHWQRMEETAGKNFRFLGRNEKKPPENLPRLFLSE